MSFGFWYGIGFTRHQPMDPATFEPGADGLQRLGGTFTLSEDAAQGAVAGAITGQTEGSTLELIDTNNSRVALDGVNIIRGATSLNFEHMPSVSFIIRETLDGETRDTTLTLEVTNVFEQPSLNALTLGSSSVPEDSAATININGTRPGSTLSFVAGALPAGMTLNSTDRTITGTPPTPGSYSFTLRELLNDSPNSPRETALSVTVSEVTTVPALAALSLSSNTATQSAASSINIIGTVNNSVLSITSGSLPAGMTLNSAARTITGTPTAEGPATFTLTETLTGSPNSPRGTSLTITIGAALPASFQRTAVATAPAITGTTYYVSPTGSDTANGTSSGTAWQTLSKAEAQLSLLQPGDAILFEGGQVFDNSNGDFWGVYQSAGGTALSRITIGSYGTGRATIRCGVIANGFMLYETSGWVLRDLILDGNGETEVGLLIATAGGRAAREANVSVINCKFINCTRDGIALGGDAGAAGLDNVLFSGVEIASCNRGFIGYGPSASSNGAPVHTNVNFDNLIVRDCVGDGFVAGHINGGAATWSRFTNNGALGLDGPVGGWMYNCDNFWFRHCVADNNKTGNTVDGDGLDIDGGCRTCGIEYCLTYNNQGAGILVCSYVGGPQANNIVRHNLCINDNNSGQTYYGGITIYTPPSGDLLENALIYNNTIVIGNTGVEPLAGDATNATVLFANNLIVSATGKHMDFAGTTTGLTLRNNQHFGAGTYKIGATTYPDFAAYQAAKSPSSFYSDPALPSVASPALTQYDATALAAAYAPGSPRAGAEPSVFGATKPAYNAFGRSTYSPPAIGAGSTVAPPAQPNLTISGPVSKAEGNSGATLFDYVVTLNREGSTAAFAFPWSVVGISPNPASANDFVATSGTVSFASGETTKTVSVQVQGDVQAEPDETFELRIADANGALGAVGRGTIANDDAAQTNFVTNGTFNELSPWDTNVPANVTTSNNVLRVQRSGSVPYVFQAVNLTQGQQYRLQVDRRNPNGDNSEALFVMKETTNPGSTTFASHPTAYNGSTWRTDTIDFTARATNAVHLVVGRENGFAEFRNVSIVAI